MFSTQSKETHTQLLYFRQCKQFCASGWVRDDLGRLDGHKGLGEDTSDQVLQSCCERIPTSQQIAVREGRLSQVVVQRLSDL